MNLDDAPAPTCSVCLRPLYADELGHQACRPCTDRVDLHLRALAGPEGLYARLGGRLMPGSGNGGPAVSGSRTAPLPLRLEPLSLLARGGVVTILQTWIVDFHELLGYTYPRWEGDLQQQCDQAVKRLRILLPWAAEKHPAFEEVAREISQLRRQCEAQVSGERPPRRVPVQCGCGQVLRITLDSDGARCPQCQAQYGHSELLDLPLAERRAAA
ncbi:hypothetical protein [Streptomyces himalayensis]|uniref:Uncharacterized protein n=1 Tax=Streptomyces himalayensis subsp. himalayensis TaxID=2756131 RepID=A0A7W0IE14_9ACTN|nr:hypothetical protein [Streptomyces himalayensis]MBA2951621.1 hypothetical protein [Streptomyces himalayensis subsp. himalayensis]